MPDPKPARPSIKTPVFRGHYVHLAAPKKTERDDGSTKEQYSMLIVLPKNVPENVTFIRALSALLLSAAQAKHGTTITKLGQLKHCPIKNGDDNDKEQFHGNWLVNVASNFPVSCIDKAGTTLDSPEDLYSGAHYRVKLSPWAWANKKGGKGVSLNLESVLKVKDDKRMGGGSDAADDFADEVTPGEAGSDADDLGI
jgi:hypothetical protein